MFDEQCFILEVVKCGIILSWNPLEIFRKNDVANFKHKEARLSLWTLNYLIFKIKTSSLFDFEKIFCREISLVFT